MEDKERCISTEEFERRLSQLESVCGSNEREDEISGEEEVTMSTNISSASTESRPLMAIGGSGYNGPERSVEVLNTSCDFPLPEKRAGHVSVTTTDGKTLVCGGVTISGRLISETASCLQFDYQSKSWKE